MSAGLEIGLSLIFVGLLQIAVVIFIFPKSEKDIEDLDRIIGPD